MAKQYNLTYIPTKNKSILQDKRTATMQFLSLQILNCNSDVVQTFIIALTSCLFFPVDFNMTSNHFEQALLLWKNVFNFLF